MSDIEWPLAFTVVGSLWAVVMIYSIKSGQQTKNEERLNSLERTRAEHDKAIQWLEDCWRVLVKSKDSK